jgi:hypothetical protein
MPIVGRRPQPRGLILGFDELTAAALGAAFPTSQVVGSPSEVRQEEWDVLVTNDTTLNSVQGHLYVLAIGTSWLGQPAEGLTYANSQITRGIQSIAREFEFPEDLPDGVKALVESDLLPAAFARGTHDCLVESVPGFLQGNKTPASVRAFLATTEGLAIAGAFVRQGGVSECWAIPEDTQSPLAWLQVALDQWRTKDANKFPAGAPWSKRGEWMNARELETVEQLSLQSARRVEVLSGLDREEAGLRAAADAASLDADRGLRRLLTARGDDLKEAVKDALTGLGFRVRDMDLEFPENDRREDLRITVSGDAKWEAVVEVRAYKGGATIADLLRLGRFSRRYAKDEGRDPGAVWYVASTQVGRDPSTREPILATNAAELEEFATDGGVAVDTSDLFRLAVAIERGIIEAAAARKLLTDSRGRFRYPAQPVPTVAKPTEQLGGAAPTRKRQAREKPQASRG